jgi:hypothetical protein
LASSVFLIVLSIAGENHLNTVWRVCFGVGIVLPLTVLVFRLRMLSSKLYRKGAIKSEYNEPYFSLPYLSLTVADTMTLFQRKYLTSWLLSVIGDR